MAVVKLCRCGRERWRRCLHDWYADVRVDGRRRRERLGPHLAEARVRAAQLDADRQAGQVRPARPGHDIPALAQRAIETTAYRPRSADARLQQRKILAAYFGRKPVEAITERDVLDFRRTLETTPRPRTKRAPSASYVRGTMALLRAALAVAQEEGLIDRAPWPLIRARARDDQRRDHLTLDQLALVIVWMRGYRPRRGPQHRVDYGGMAELALLTGLRLGELLALRRESIDLERGLLRVSATAHRGGRIGPPKTPTSARPVALSPRAREVVAAAVRPGLIFPVSQDSCRDVLDLALDAHGWKRPGVSWHEFRHAHTAMLDAAGVGLRSAGARMGHGAHFAQTAAYGWTAEAVAVEALDAVWAAHATPPAEA